MRGAAMRVGAAIWRLEAHLLQPLPLSLRHQHDTVQQQRRTLGAATPCHPARLAARAAAARIRTDICVMGAADARLGFQQCSSSRKQQ